MNPSPAALLRRRPLAAAMLAASSPLAMGHALAAVTPSAGSQVQTVTTGNTIDVTTAKVVGDSRIAQFDSFQVGQGLTVNLYLQNSARLINIIKSSPVQIDGVVNSYKNIAGSQVGGSVFFIAPQGFAVGSTGVLNMGALTVVTPTQSFAQGIIDGDTDKIAALTATDGSIPLASDGSIVISGKVNTLNGINLHAPTITVNSGAEIKSGQAGLDAFSSTVNAQAIPSATDLVVGGGVIELVADYTGTNAAGQMTATNAIDVSGKLQGVKLVLNAASTADNNISEDLGQLGISTLPGLLTGVSGDYVHADADASVHLHSGADLISSGFVSLKASTVANAATLIPVVTQGGPGSVAIIFAKADADATVTVDSGATIAATGNLAISATNTTAIGATAIAIGNPSDDKTAGADAAAVGQGDIHATVTVDHGATVSAAGAQVLARNDNAIDVSATSYAANDSPAGFAVAYTDVDDTATATFSANLGTAANKTGSVSIAALSNTTKNNTAASTDVGPTITNKIVGKVPSTTGTLSSKIQGSLGTELPELDSQLTEAESTSSAGDGTSTGSQTAKSKGRIGSAVSVARQTHTAEASLGDGGANAPDIESSGRVSVAAKTYDAPIHSKAASGVGSGAGSTGDSQTSVGISVAVAYGDYTHTTHADIAPGAVVNAGLIGVSADTEVPVDITWQKWDDFASIKAHLNGDLGVANTIANGWANSNGDATKLGLAGSVNLQFLTDDTRAWVGSGAQLTATTASIARGYPYGDGWTTIIAPDWTQTFTAGLDVDAIANVGSIEIGGNISITGAGIGNGQDGGGGSVVGGSFVMTRHKDTTLAGIDADAVASSAQKVQVLANTTDFLFSVAPTSGRGSSISATGMVSFGDLDDTTHAVISKDAQVSAPKVAVDAELTDKVVNIAASYTSSTNSAVGASIALNKLTGDTQGFIGDASADSPTSATGTTPGYVHADQLDVLGGTDGFIVAAAAAGAGTSQPGAGEEQDLPDAEPPADTGGETGKGGETPGQLSQAWTKVKGKLSTGANAVLNKLGKGTAEGEDVLKIEPNPDQTANGISITATGASAVNLTTLTTKAIVSGASLDHYTAANALATRVLATSAPYLISGAGAGAKAAPAGGTTSAAIAGSITVDDSSNRAEAGIVNTTVADAGDTTVRALNGGLRASAALGVAITSGGGSTTGEGAGGLSLLFNGDSAGAYLTGSTVTGKTGAASRDVDVDAYNAAYMGAGGGAGYSGGSGGLGMSVTYLGTSDPDGHAATEALLTNSTLSAVDDVQVRASDSAVLVGLAATVGVGSTEFGAEASAVYGKLDRTTKALVTGSTITASNLTVASNGQRNSDWDSDLLRGAPGAASMSGYDFTKGGLPDDTQVSADSDGSDGTLDFSKGSGALGIFFAGSGGESEGSTVGVSLAAADITDEHAAALNSSTINLGTGTASITASESALLVGAAVGISVADGTLAGAGSVTLLQSGTKTSATVGGSGTTTVNARTVTVQATNASTLAALAGAFSYSGGSVAAGASVAALTGKDMTTATAKDAALNASSALNVLTAQNGLYVDVAFAGAASESVALGGAGTINLIGNGTQSLVSGVTMTQTAADVTVRANDQSSIYTAAVGLGFGESGAAGAAFVLNTLTDPDSDSGGGPRVLAKVSGGTIVADDVTVDAESTSNMGTVAAGAAVGDDVGLGGSLIVSDRSGSTRALIADGALIKAQDNVKLQALSSDVVTLVAGGIGVAAEGAGAGLAGVINIMGGDTEAAITGSATRVDALATSGDTMTVYDGGFEDAPDLGDITSASGFLFSDFSLATRQVAGLSIGAISKQREAIISLGVGGAGEGFAAAANFAVNYTSGLTSAHVDNAQINKRFTGSSTQDVNIQAADHTYGENLVVAGAFGGLAAAVGAAINVNDLHHGASAYSLGGTIAAQQDVRIAADSTQDMVGLTAGLGGALVGGSASLSITTYDVTTSAYALGGALQGQDGVTVSADNEAGSNLNTTALSGGAGAAGAGVGVIQGENTTYAGIGRLSSDGTTLAVQTDTASLDVDASHTTDHHLHTVGGAAGGAGLAGMGTILLMSDGTNAGLYGSKVRAWGGGAADHVGVKATETLNADLVTGALAGGGTAGIGASVAVLSSSTAVGAVVGDGADASATSVNVEADSAKDYGSIIATAGVGASAGLAASVGVILVGGGSASSSDTGTSSSDIFSAASGLTSDSAGLDVSTYAPDADAGATASLENAGSYDKPKTTDTFAPSAVLARVADSTVAGSSVTVKADDSLTTRQDVGSLGAGGVGVGAGVGYTGVKDAVTANIDSASTVTAGSVSVASKAHDGDHAAAQVNGYVGAGGGFGLGAAAAVSVLANSVSASAAGDLQGKGGSGDLLAIKAEDATSGSTDNYNAVVGGVAGGAVVSVTQKKGSVTADLAPAAGANSSSVSGFDSVTVDAISSGALSAKGVAAAGGVAGAATGVYTLAQDDTDTYARLGVADISTGVDGVAVNALSTPDAHSEILGVTVSGGLSLGAEVADAKLTGETKAGTANGITLSGAGALTVQAKMALASDGYNADAKAIAGTGGYLAAANATASTAVNDSDVQAWIGDSATLGSGALNVLAERDTQVKADSEGVTVGGVVAAGGNVSTANLSGAIHATVGKGLSSTGSLGDITVRAGTGAADPANNRTTGKEGALATATSGSGSTIAVAAGEGDVTVDTDVYAGFTGDTTAHAVNSSGAIKLAADYAVDGQSTADTLQAALAGGSGAVAKRDIKSKAKAEVGAKVALAGADISVKARQYLAADASGTKTGAGGAVNANAGISRTQLDADTSIAVGDNASLTAAGDTGDLRLLAANVAFGHDSSTMTTGGLVEVPVLEDTTTSNLKQTVTVGANADLTSLNDLSVGTYGLVTANATSSVSTYGVVSSATGQAHTDLTQTNSVTFGANAQIVAGNDITLAAGRSGDGFSDSDSHATANSDVYNWTADPISTYAAARATTTSTSTLTVGTGAQVSALGDVTLTAYDPTGEQAASGVAHNPYLSLFSIDDQNGQTSSTASSSIALSGTVVAGAGAKQSVDVAADGTLSFGATTAHTAAVVGSYNPYNEMQTRIDALNARLANDSTLTPDDRASIGASIEALQNAQNSMPSHLEGDVRVGDSLTAVQVGALTAKAGDISVDAKSLTVNGSATLTANGGANISIASASPDYLLTNDLSIPLDHATGGTISFTRGAGATNGLTVNQIDVGVLPLINVVDTAGSGTPFILMSGTVTNYGGLVNIANDTGSIAMFGSMYARQVQLSAPNGTYTYDNSAAYYPTGAAPEAVWDSFRLINGSTSNDEIVQDFASRRLATGATTTSGLNSNLLYGTSYEGQSGTDNIGGTWDGSTYRSKVLTLLFNLPNPDASHDNSYTQFGSSDFWFKTVPLLATTKTGTLAQQPSTPASRLYADSIFINAGYIDVNSTVVAGKANNYVANIGADAAAAMTNADQLYASGQSTGGVLDLTNLATVGNWEKVKVTYDVANHKLSVDDLDASGGGLVYLTGRIVSTSNTGKIQVNNGAGTVQITNTSGRILTLNDINTGQELRGEVRITDLGRAGNDTPLTTWYIDTPGAGLQVYNDAANPGVGLGGATLLQGASSSYQPLPGRRYNWATTYDLSRQLTYDNNYFYNSTAGAWVKTATTDTAGWFTTNTGDGSAFSTRLSTAFNPATDADFLNVNITCGCRHLGVADGDGQTYDLRLSVIKNVEVTETSSVRADYPIAIAFSGGASGSVGVVSNGSITVAGNIVNPTGTTSLQAGTTDRSSIASLTTATGAGGASITETAGGGIDAKWADLLANGSIGTALQPLSIVLPTTGGTNLSARTTGGSLYLDVSGTANVGDATALNGDVSIAATHGIYNYTNSFTGDSITLNGGDGGVGAAGAPIYLTATVNSSLRAGGHGVVSASADGDIYLRKASGDLMVATLDSAHGAVWLQADSGGVYNALPGVRVDDENKARLAGVWDDLNLSDAQKAIEATVTPFQNAVKAEYAEYWTIRSNTTASGGQLTLADGAADLFRPAVAAKLGVATPTDAQVLTYIQGRYDAINTDIQARFGANGPTGTAGSTQAATGFYTYAADWDFALAPTSTLYAQLTSGAGAWTSSQLENSLNSQALVPVSNTQILLHDPNASGANVTLNAIGGSVGALASNYSFVVASGSVLTDDQKAHLAAALPGDVVLTGATLNGQSATKVTIRQRNAFAIAATGNIDAQASGNVLLAGDGVGNITRAWAGGTEYLAFAGGLTDQSPGPFDPAARATALVLEAGAGSIGSAADPFKVSTPDLSSVRAAQDVYVYRPYSGAMMIGLGYAGGTLSLNSYGGLLSDFAPDSEDLHLQGHDIVLTSGQGVLGAPGRRLQVAVSGGTLSATGYGLDVYSPGRALNLGAISTTNGGAIIAAGGDITFTQGASTVGLANNTGTSATRADLQVTTPGAVHVESATGLSAYAGSVLVSANGITFDDASPLNAHTYNGVGGDVNLSSTAGITLGDAGAFAFHRLDLAARGDIDLGAGTYASGQADLTVRARGDVDVADGGKLKSYRNLSLQAANLTLGDDSEFSAQGDLVAQLTGAFTAGDGVDVGGLLTNRLWVDAASASLGSNLVWIGVSDSHLITPGAITVGGGANIRSQQGELRLQGTSLTFQGDLLGFGGRSLQLATTSGGIGFGGALQLTGGRIDIQSKGAVTGGTHAYISGDNGASLAARGAVGFTDTFRLLSSAGTVSLSGASITLGDSATLTGAGRVSVAAASGDASFGEQSALTSNNSSLQVTGRGIGLGGLSQVKAAGSATLSGSGAVTVGNSSTLNASSASLTGKSLTLGDYTNVTASSGAIVAKATGGDANFSNNHLTGTSLQLGATGLLSLRTGFTATPTTGGITVQAGQLSVANGVALDAPGDVTVSVAQGASFGDGVSLTSDGAVTLAVGSLSNGDGFVADAGGVLSLVSTQGALDLEHSTLTAGTQAYLISAGDLVLARAKLRSYGSATLSMHNTDGSFGGVDLESTAGTLSISGTGDMAIGGTDRLVAGRDLIINLKGGFGAEDGGTLSGGRSLSLTAASAYFYDGAHVSSDGAVTLTTTADRLMFGVGGTTVHAGGALTLTAAGLLDIRSGATLDAATDSLLQGGSMSLANGSEVKITPYGKQLAVLTTSGDLDVEAGAKLTATQLNMRVANQLDMADGSALAGGRLLKVVAGSAHFGKQASLGSGGTATVTVTGALAADDQASISGAGGTRVTAGSIGGGGRLTLHDDAGLAVTTTTGDLDLGDSASVGGAGAVLVSAKGRLGLGAGGRLTAGAGGLGVTAGSLRLGDAAQIDSTGPVTLAVTGAAQIGSGDKLYSGKSLSLTAGSVDAGTHLFAWGAGKLTIATAGDFAMDSGVLGSATMSLADAFAGQGRTRPAASPNHGVSVTAGGLLQIGDPTVVDPNDATFVVPGTVNVASAGDATLIGGTFSSGALSVKAAGAVGIGTRQGSLTIGDGSSVASAQLALTSAGALSIGGASQTDGSSMGSDGAVQVTAAGALTIAGNDPFVRSAASISGGGTGLVRVQAASIDMGELTHISGGGEVRLITTGDVSMADYAYVRAEGALNTRLGSVHMDHLAQLTAGGVVTLNAGDMLLGRLRSDLQSGVSIVVNSTGGIRRAAGTFINLDNLGASTATLTAVNGIGVEGYGIVYGAALPTATSADGQVWLEQPDYYGVSSIIPREEDTAVVKPDAADQTAKKVVMLKLPATRPAT